MGNKSIQIQLDSIETYEQVQTIIQQYDRQYDLVGLILYKPTKRYYMLVECRGNFFVKKLQDIFEGKISRLDNFLTIQAGNSCQISNAIYFNDEVECLDHYLRHGTATAG